MIAAVIFVFPGLLIPYAPWTLTPLTAQALAWRTAEYAVKNWKAFT